MQKKLIAAVTGAALAAGMGLGMTQFAQADTASPTPTPSTSSSAPADDSRPMNGQGRQGAMNGMGSHDSARATTHMSDLATKLGIPEETVTEAMSKVRDDFRATRPTAGSTDPADRDAAREERRAGMAAALAEELGIDEATVSTALSELQADAQATRTANRQATLDQAVTDGKLTQAEADAAQKVMDSGLMGNRGGGHGHR